MTEEMENKNRETMKKKKTLCQISNQVYKLNIPQELYDLRDAFCPSKESVTCSNTCPIFKKYYGLRLSCNEALDRHPDDCITIISRASACYNFKHRG